MSNIFKYQGGDISSLFVNYVPFQGLEIERPTSSKSSSSEKESKKDEVGLKDFLNLTKELKGLPVDMAIVGSKIKTLLSDNLLFNNGELSTSNIVSMYLSTLLDIRKAEYNEKAFTDARKQVIDAGGLNEVALDREGNIFVQDQESGKIIPISVEEYNSVKGETTEDGKQKYQPLTNNNLLYYREHDPNFAFKNGILNVVNNGIGIDEVTKLLQQVANHIGENTLKYEGLSERTKDGIIKGFMVLNGLQKEFASGMSLDGIYKQNILTKDQMDQAKLALNYLWNTLPNNAKSLLKFKGGSNEGAFNLIQTLVFSGLDYSREYTQSLIKNPNSEDNNSKSSSSSDKDDKSNPYFNMVKQIGGTETPIIIRKGNTWLSLIGTNYSSLPDMSGKPIESTSVDDLLNRGLGGIVTDRNAITFGNQVVKSSDLTNIMYDNSGGTMMILPCKKVGGRTVVDLSIIEDYEDAVNEIKELQNPTEEQIAEIYVKHGLMQLVDQSTGLPNRNRFAQFLVIDAYGVNKNDFLQSSEFLQEVNPDDDLVDRITHALSLDKKKNDYKFDPNDKWAGEFSYDEVYKGVMYIPITINELQAVTAFDKKATNFYQREQDYQDMMKRISAGSSKSNEL